MGFKLNTPDLESRAQELSQLSKISRVSRRSRKSRTQLIHNADSQYANFKSFLNDEQFQMNASDINPNSLQEDGVKQAAAPGQLDWLKHESVVNAFDEWGF